MNTENISPEKKINEQKLLKIIKEKKLKNIAQIRNGGHLHYEGLEEVTNEIGQEELKNLLNKLASKNNLIAKTNESTIFCPHCDSVSINSRYECPRCQSYNVKKIQLIEHKLCGYIGNIKEFGTGANLVCPKCKTEIGNYFDAKDPERVDNRRTIKLIGSTFECEKCGSKFEKPNITHKCESCTAAFNYKDAIYEKVYTYEVPSTSTEPTVNEKKNQSLNAISEILIKNGYNVEVDTKLPGKSGVEQHFDIAAKKGRDITLIDISTEGNQNDIISLLGKKMDLDAKSIILLDITGNERLASLGKSYEIEVLDGRDEKHLEKLVNLLTDADKGRQNGKGINPFRRRKTG